MVEVDNMDMIELYDDIINDSYRDEFDGLLIVGLSFALKG